MNGSLLGFTIILLLAGVFQIATVAVGIQCYHENTIYKTNNQNNYNFLLSQVIASVLVLVLSFVGIYIAFT